MLNNKGFAVSTVLYTLLIAFLLFLGAALAMFSSSSSVVGSANNDLINGNVFSARQVKNFIDKDGNIKTCKALGTNKGSNDVYWYEGNTLVKINSKYGTMYWPQDFGLTVENGILTGKNVPNKNIEVKCYEANSKLGDCTGLSLITGVLAEPPVTPPVTPPGGGDSGTTDNKWAKIPIKSVNNTVRTRINDLVYDGAYSETSESLWILKEVYTPVKELISKIEKQDSAQNADMLIPPPLYIENATVSCITGNQEIKSSDACTDDSNSDWDISLALERFEDYLGMVQSKVNGTTYSYDDYNKILLQRIKFTLWGSESYLEVKYYPVVYKIMFDNDYEAQDDNNDTYFNTIFYYDLVPVLKGGDLMTGKDMDQLNLSYYDQRIGGHVFFYGEFDSGIDSVDPMNFSNDIFHKKMIMPMNLTKTATAKTVATEKPMPKVSLSIRDTTNDMKLANSGNVGFGLYDICE